MKPNLPEQSGTYPEGFAVKRKYLGYQEQRDFIATVRAIVKEAPLFQPEMPRSGKPLSVRMTNCGSLGWLTDRTGGYRYQAFHPVTGKLWPDMPRQILDIWKSLLPESPLPEACLINFYTDKAKMGMHQDRDEEALDVPVVSISLGDSCRFRIGGTKRGGKTGSILLESGDVIILGGSSRLCYHGVDRIYAGTSDLLKDGGRLNLTLRRVNRPVHAG
jgi:DNA oxidative demethylase